jgi:tetratricopeptide (TPR) repeat protein
MTLSAPAQAHALHIGIAEAGKLLALRGRHRGALDRYREALRLAQSMGAPQVFARHYLHCVLESLELMGEHQQAEALALEAAQAADRAEPSAFQRRDRACLLERQGMNQLKRGDTAGARQTLAAALALDGTLQCTRAVLDWTARSLTLNPGRLADAQRRYGYFTVRADAVDPRRVRTLATTPQEMLHGRRQ